MYCSWIGSIKRALTKAVIKTMPSSSGADKGGMGGKGTEAAPFAIALTLRKNIKFNVIPESSCECHHHVG